MESRAAGLADRHGGARPALRWSGGRGEKAGDRRRTVRQGRWWWRCFGSLEEGGCGWLGGEMWGRCSPLLCARPQSEVRPLLQDQQSSVATAVALRLCPLAGWLPHPPGQCTGQDLPSPPALCFWRRRETSEHQSPTKMRTCTCPSRGVLVRIKQAERLRDRCRRLRVC